jgi:FkbM family methyltransferase
MALPCRRYPRFAAVLLLSLALCYRLLSPSTAATAARPSMFSLTLLVPDELAPLRPALPLPPSPQPSPSPLNAQLTSAQLGVRGAAPPSPAPSPAAFLAPTYCAAQACAQSQGCAVAEGFRRLLPSEVAIAAAGGCHWAAVRALTGVRMCTHDPARDTQVSHYLHARGSWVAAEELAAFLQVACSPTRPFMLDVGSNIGSYSVPAAALGCHVVAFDPAVENLGRVVESVRRLGVAALERAAFYNNFVGAVHSHRSVVTNSDNMGGTTFGRTALDPHSPGSNASFVVLDELFSLPSRPLSPLTGLPMAPSEVGFVKVDAEGCDIEIFFRAQRLLQEGRVPFLTIEFTSSNSCQAACRGSDFLDHMYALGYAFYEPWAGSPRPAARKDIGGGVYEWWFVHKDAALPKGWVGVQDSLAV